MNKLIDHTVLKAVTQKEDVKKICEEAIEQNFKSVCINPCFVSYANGLLKDSEVLVCTVIGFPLGANTTETKAFETENAVNNGADEIDMVINVGALKDKEYDYVENDIRSVVESAKGKLVKVIIETCYLTDDEKKIVCELAVKAGANFVKTSTGFGTGGATKEDVMLMRKTVGPDIGVKASGGVRSTEDLQQMIEAGATRIGTSSGVLLMQGKKSNTDY
ncbi:deoxyribose-phosphate aldolase [Mycoplasmatota bacterium WC44]